MARPRRNATCHPDRPHRANGLCQACYSEEYERNHPRDKDEVRATKKRYNSQPHIKARAKEYDRRKQLEKYQDFSIEAYDSLFLLQGGACAICGSEKPGRKYSLFFCVDHDHITGKVRGLLCVNCNAGLGQFKDDPTLLERAASYLREPLT